MWNVYISGNFDMIVAAYNALAMMFSDGHNIYYGAAVISLLFLFITALQRVSDDSHKPVQNFFFGWIIFMMLAGPTSRVTVLVESRITQQVQTVDNVPLLVAISGSIATTLLSRITEDLQTAFEVITPINGYGAQNTGTIDPLRALMKLNQQDYITGSLCMLGGGNVDYCGTLNNYMRDCVGRDLVTGGPAQDVSLNTISHAGPSDIIDTIKVNNNNWTTENVVRSGSPTTMSCSQTFTYLKGALTGPQYKAQVDAFNAKMGIDEKAIEDATAMLTGSAIAVYDMALQRMIWSATKNGLGKAFDKVGLQTEMMQFTAKEQRLVKMAGSYEMFNELAPALITFFEFFSIFIAPLMLLMLVTGKFGLQAAGSYAMFVMFTNLWPLIAVGVESYLNYALTTDMSSSGSFGPAAMSWNGSPGVLEKAQTYLAVGSMMMAAIPSLAMAVLYKGVHSMQGVAKQASPDAPVNAHYVAPNIASAPDNGATKMGSTTSTWDPYSSTGGGVISSANGPLSSVVNAGSAVGSSISKNLTAVHQRMDQAIASAQESYAQVTQAGRSALNNSSFNTSEKAQISDSLNATQSAVKAYAEAFNISYGEAATRIAQNANAASKEFMAQVGGGFDFGVFSATGKLGAKSTSTETDTRGQTEEAGENHSSGRSGSTSNAMANSVNAAFTKASDYLTGHTIAGNASYSDAANKMVSSTKNYSDSKSVVDQMAYASNASTNGSLNASIDIGELAQRAKMAGNVFDAQQTVDRVMAQNADARESFLKAGVIGEDGQLTDNARIRINKIADGAKFTGVGISNVAATSIGAATYLIEAGMSLTGGLDSDDRAVAAAVYRDMNETAPNAGLQQLVKVNEAASQEDRVSNYVELNDGAAANLAGQVAGGTAKTQTLAAGEFGEAQGNVNSGQATVHAQDSENRGETVGVAMRQALANNGGKDDVTYPLAPNRENGTAATMKSVTGALHVEGSDATETTQAKDLMESNNFWLGQTVGDSLVGFGVNLLPDNASMNKGREWLDEAGDKVANMPGVPQLKEGAESFTTNMDKMVDQLSKGFPGKK
ncbi:conjugal transfer protein TraG N-terminal domain-containing protein [Aeromonas caviae]